MENLSLEKGRVSFWLPLWFLLIFLSFKELGETGIFKVRGKKEKFNFESNLLNIYWELTPSVAIQFSIHINLPLLFHCLEFCFVSEMSPKFLFLNNRLMAYQLALLRVSIPFSGFIKEIFTQDFLRNSCHDMSTSPKLLCHQACPTLIGSHSPTNITSLSTSSLPQKPCKYLTFVLFVQTCY